MACLLLHCFVLPLGVFEINQQVPALSFTSVLLHLIHSNGVLTDSRNSSTLDGFTWLKLGLDVVFLHPGTASAIVETANFPLHFVQLLHGVTVNVPVCVPFQCSSQFVPIHRVEICLCYRSGVGINLGGHYLCRLHDDFVSYFWAFGRHWPGSLIWRSMSSCCEARAFCNWFMQYCRVSAASIEPRPSIISSPSSTNALSQRSNRVRTRSSSACLAFSSSRSSAFSTAISAINRSAS